MSTSCLTDWLSQKETQQVANATTVTSLKNQILSQHELLVLKKEAKILKKSFHFWFLEIYFSKIFFIYVSECTGKSQVEGASCAYTLNQCFSMSKLEKLQNVTQWIVP